ncbi:MAG: SDR family oxidoreductase [Desulfobacterales bacterium]
MMKDLFDLKGKTALITGGSRGIGKGIARGLASRGADIAIAARNEDRMRRTADAIEAEFKTKTACLRVDVRSKAQIDDMVKETVEIFGGIHVLVNNAGILMARLPQDLSTEEWDRVIDINLKSVFLCSKAVYPVMKAAGGGKIICIGSMYSIFGGFMSASYGAAKGGVVQLVRSLAVAWAPDNIQVNAILPGWIETDMILESERNFPGMSEWVVSRTPAGRMGRIDDMAGTAAFLSSPGSDFVTGVSIPVDGGWSVMG